MKQVHQHHNYDSLVMFPGLPQLQIDCLQQSSQFLHTVGSQKPELGKAWEQDFRSDSLQDHSYNSTHCQWNHQQFLYSNGHYYLAKPVSHLSTTMSCMQLTTKLILVCVNFAESCQSFNLEWNISWDSPPAIVPLWSDSQYMFPDRKLSQHMGRGTYRNKYIITINSLAG